MNKSRCAVVIPVYKRKLNKFEHASLLRTCAVLGGQHDLYFVAPESFEKTKCYETPVDIRFVRFEDKYFQSVDTYSKLCELPGFYGYFLDAGYEFMLICQLDAWVFFDRLEHFMNMGYDYFGGPHYQSGPWSGFRNGNGGLSLRRLSAMYEACVKTDFSHNFKPEDCAFTNDCTDILKLAPVDVCFTFSIQQAPVKYEYLNDIHCLPMGTHQPYISQLWHRFWSKYIPVDRETMNEPYECEE